MPDRRTPLYGLTLSELKELAAAEGLPAYAGGQIASWLYRRGAPDLGAMTDLPLAARARLAERYEVGLEAPLDVAVSSDGTRKYLYRAAGRYVESAYIPDGGRATLCVSSQAGCRMGCRFCATGRMGAGANLSAGAILNQAASLPERASLTNMVYMGMGEPLDNPDEVLRSLEIITSPWGWGWSPSRVTVSTVGVLPALERFLEGTEAALAVSLHSPFPDERAALMPAEKAWPAAEVVKAIKRASLPRRRRVSFEYIVLRGVNDTPAHVKGLARLLGGLRCRVNLIRYHSAPGMPWESPSQQEMGAFRDALAAKGFTVTVRASRGEDIRAACGLLSTEKPTEGGL